MHQMLHRIENNPEETMNLALTHKEFLNIILGLYATDIFFPCLAPEDGVGNEFQVKLLEIVSVQKPEWVMSPEELEELEQHGHLDFDSYDEDDEDDLR